MAEKAEWLTVGQMSDVTGIPETTLRRYAKRYKHFLRIKGGGQGKKAFYHAESAETFKKIAMLHQDEGMSAEMVLQELKQDGHRETMDAETDATPTTPATRQEAPEAFKQIAQALMVIASQAEENKALVAKQRKMAAEMEDLKQRIDRLEGKPRGGGWWRRVLERVKTRQGDGDM